MANDKGLWNYVLPASVLAYVASPEVRKGVREVVVKGVATVLDITEKASEATSGLKGEWDGLLSDAEKARQEAKKPPIHVEVVNDEEAAQPA